MSHLSITIDELEYWLTENTAFCMLILFFFHQARCILCTGDNSKLFLLVKVFQT